MVPNANLFSFMFFQVDFGKVLPVVRMSASKTQMLLEKTIFHKY